MQFPRASKDLLMLAPSLNRAPLLDVTIARSDPAKSIRDIFPMVNLAFKLAVLSLCLTNTCYNNFTMLQMKILLVHYVSKLIQNAALVTSVERMCIEAVHILPSLTTVTVTITKLLFVIFAQ